VFKKMENQTGKKIKKARPEDGGEYVDEEHKMFKLKTFNAEASIAYQGTSYTPQHKCTM
jgi:hypothetical protein